MGRDLSGIVEKIGSKVTKFKPGDHVYGMAEELMGTNCQFVTCHENSLALKPTNLTFNEAASLPLTALTAYYSLFEVGKLEAGQSVLVLGGSGGVGVFAVQVSKLSIIVCI